MITHAHCKILSLTLTFHSSHFAIDCGSLDDPDHGNVDVSKTTFGGTATYTCDPEYRLVGNSMRICANSREWTGQTPICESTSE